MDYTIVISIVGVLPLVAGVFLLLSCGPCGCGGQSKKKNKKTEYDVENGQFIAEGVSRKTDINDEPTFQTDAQSITSVDPKEGSSTLMDWMRRCLSCRKQRNKENKNAGSDPENDRFISEDVAAKIDSNNEPTTLLTNAHSTSSGNRTYSMAGVIIWLRKTCCCKKQSEENKKDKEFEEEDGRSTCISTGAATQNTQSTSSVDPVFHIEDEKAVRPTEVLNHPITVQSVRGLKNLGNTCYFNSTMQALVHTNLVFRKELEKLRTNRTFVEQVLDFFSSMQSDNSSANSPHSPEKLHHIFGKRSPRFADGGQHDSHECLRNFLDNIRKEEREISGAVDKRRVLTVVDSVFGGHFITVYICEDCGTPYHVFEALLDISLPIMIDEEDLVAMNAARIIKQKKSVTVMPQTVESKTPGLDNSKKRKIEISIAEPDCKSPATEADIGQKSSKRMRHKSTNQSRSKAENSTTEIQSTIISVQPMTTDKDDGDDAKEESVGANKAELECDKQSVSHVKVEEVTENAQKEKVGQQAQQKNDEVTEDVEADLVKKENCDRYRETINSLMTPLSLSSPYLPKDERAMRKHVTVHDCLSYFTREEHITKEYLCNDCYARNPPNEGEDPLLTSATKQTLIFNPPAILTLHLKRFELKEGGSVKRNDMITYEELLDIAPYCSSRCLRNYPPCQNIWYSLYGVVVHHGSTLKSGHYTAYVKIRDHENEADFRKLLQKNFFDRDLTRERLIEMMQENHSDMTRTCRPTCKQPSGTWYCMDDSSFRKVSVTTVLNQEAYLLFYERMS